jgi:hypothetical protein
MTKPSPSPSGGSYTVPITEDALCCDTVRDFVVIGGLSSDRYAIRWSAIGDVTDWPVPATDDARSKQAGTQTFPSEYGWVTAIAGNDFFAYVFQERAITKMQYVGGDVVFSFDAFEEDRGCVSMGRALKIDDMVIFESDRGFHRLDAGQITDIGFGIVDQTYT